MTLKTSWTDSQLEQLYKPFNHKIEFDGYQYKWLHKLDGVWNIHSLKLFDDENSLVSNMKLCYYLWEMELKNRIKKQSLFHLKNNRIELRMRESVFRIAQSELKTKTKIEQIQLINPNISTKELCNLLEKEKGIICRYNREINNKSTLLSA